MSSSEADAVAISKTVSDLALLALELGMLPLRDGRVLAPFVLIDSTGVRYVRSFADEAEAEALQAAKALITREADDKGAYALAYDGTITVEGAACDAVLVIAGEFSAPGAFVFAQRYTAEAELLGPPALIGQHEPLIEKAP